LEPSITDVFNNADSSKIFDDEETIRRSTVMGAGTDNCAYNWRAPQMEFQTTLKSNRVMFVVEWKRTLLPDYIEGIPQQSRKFWFEDKGVACPNCVPILIYQL